MIDLMFLAISGIYTSYWRTRLKSMNEEYGLDRVSDGTQEAKKNIKGNNGMKMNVLDLSLLVVN